MDDGTKKQHILLFACQTNVINLHIETIYIVFSVIVECAYNLIFLVICYLSYNS